MTWCIINCVALMVGSHFHWTPCLRTISTTGLQTVFSFAGRCPIAGFLVVAPGFCAMTFSNFRTNCSLSIGCSRMSIVKFLVACPSSSEASNSVNHLNTYMLTHSASNAIGRYQHHWAAPTHLHLMKCFSLVALGGGGGGRLV
jgi:hypothetical protein